MTERNYGYGEPIPSELSDEFVSVLSTDTSTDLDTLVAEKSVEDRREAKCVLRMFLDKGIVTTVPSFEYKLSPTA